MNVTNILKIRLSDTQFVLNQKLKDTNSMVNKVLSDRNALKQDFITLVNVTNVLKIQIFEILRQHPIP
jgi:hypothetical protein